MTSKKPTKKEITNILNSWYNKLVYYNEGWGEEELKREKQEIFRYLKI